MRPNTSAGANPLKRNPLLRQQTPWAASRGFVVVSVLLVLAWILVAGVAISIWLLIF